MPNSRIEPLKRVLEVEPDDDVAWFGLGKAYMDDGSWTEAADALERCISVKPTYSAAYLALAECLKKLNHLGRCREICALGIDVSRTNGDAMVTKNLEMLLNGLPAA